MNNYYDKYLNNSSVKEQNQDSLAKAFTAIYQKDEKTLENLLRKELNPNRLGPNGETLLNFAIKTKNIKSIKLLLENGADPNLASSSPNVFSIKSNLTEFFGEKFTLNHTTPLMTLLNLENKSPKELQSTQKITDLLLSHGASVDISEPIHNLTPLHFAANKGEPSLVKALLDHGANPNAVAFKNPVPGISLFVDSKVTPALLATQTNNIYKSSECIDALVQKGSDISIHNNVPFQYSPMIFLLNLQNPEKAGQILNNQLNFDFEKMKKENVDKALESFLNIGSKKDSIFDSYVEELLREGADFKNQYNDIKYFAHLNSWNGDIAKKDIAIGTSNSTENHSIQESEGWLADFQIPKKIKNLLYIYQGVHDNKIDCTKKFEEPKDVIKDKLKEEIYNQITTFFTSSHIEYASNLPNPHSAIPTADPSLNTPSWYFNNAPDLKRDIEKTLVLKWSEKISNLKPGESFCTYLGTSDHATYLEFKKENDKNLTRVIYNLGGGIENHQQSLDKKIYPHMVKDIPTKYFENNNQKGLSYLLTIINSSKQPCYDTKTGGLNQAFNAVYIGPYSLEGNAPNEKDLNKLTPMKQQVVGNCSVKNNLCAMRNRLQNDNLYRFIKNYEVLTIKKSINIGSKLFKEKELEKDVAYLSMIASTRGKSPVSAEKDLFRFLQKRSDKVPDNLTNKPGDRVAYAINHIRKNDLMDNYFSHCPTLFKLISDVAEHYKSKELTNTLANYSKRFEISKNKTNHNLIRQKLSREFDLIPSTGQNVLSSEFSGEKKSIEKEQNKRKKELEPSSKEPATKKRKSNDFTL